MDTIDGIPLIKSDNEDLNSLFPQGTDLNSYQKLINQGFNNKKAKPYGFGETIRGMQYVSPLLEKEFLGLNSKDVSDLYFIDGTKTQKDNLEVIVDCDCEVDEFYLKKNFKTQAFNYYIDDDGKKGETKGDTKLFFKLYETNDKIKFRNAHKCIEATDNEVLIFLFKDDSNSQLLLAKSGKVAQNIFIEVSKKKINDYRPFEKIKNLLGVDYKNWLNLLINGSLSGKNMTAEKIIDAINELMKILYTPAKALGWIFNKIGDGVDVLKIEDSFWDEQNDEFFFKKENLIQTFTFNDKLLTDLQIALKNDPDRLEFSDLIPNFIAIQIDDFIGKLKEVISVWNTKFKESIEKLFKITDKAQPILDVLKLRETLAFYCGIWNGLVDFVSGIFKFIGLILEAPYDIFDNFDSILKQLGEFFTSLKAIDFNTFSEVYKSFKKALSELDFKDIDLAKVAYITGFGLAFVGTMFIPVANVAHLAKVEKFGKFGKLLFEVLGEVQKGLNLATYEATELSRQATQHIWKELKNILTLFKNGGEELTKFLENIWKKILEWFKKNKEKLDNSLGFVKSIQQHFDDIAGFRIKNGLPKFAKEVSESGTVAKVEVNGKSFFGINSGLSPESLALRRKWFELINKKLIPPRAHLGRLRFLNHAEAHALINAFEEAGKISNKLTLFVDRVTCPFCRSELKYLLKELKIDELKIINSITNEILILKP